MTESATISCILPDAAVQQEKRRVTRQLQQLRSDLLLCQPFVAVLAMRLQLVVVADDRLPTACTDSHRVFFNLNFINSCNTSQKKFVLAHEVWHCVMGHFIRRQDRDMQRWNYACDYEVNGILRAYFMHDDMPANILFSDDYQGKSAEQIYQILGKLSPDAWQQTDGWGRDTLPVADAQFDQHQPEHSDAEHNAIHIDPDYQPQRVSEQDANRWREYTAAAQVTGIMAGNHGSSMQKIINNVLSPQLSWPDLLQRFIQRTISGSYSWQRPARRYLAQGLYLPGRQGKKLNISLAIDTSGSTLADLPLFLAEISGILRQFEQVQLQVISCDAVVTDVSYYEKADLPALVRWQAKGGGGTDFKPVFNYLEHDVSDNWPPQVLIFFTDGYGSAPQNPPSYPVIWVLTPHGNCPATWGEVITLS